MSKAGHWLFEFNPRAATTLRHTLNRKYRGAQKFELRAPDAPGTLIVWARTAQEADEHVVNALFDLIFDRKRVGAFLDNPVCIYCGGPTQSRGRNSSGSQTWTCRNPSCRRSSHRDAPLFGVAHAVETRRESSRDRDASRRQRPAQPNLRATRMKTPTHSVKMIRREIERARKHGSMAVVHPDTLEWMVNLLEGEFSWPATARAVIEHHAANKPSRRKKRHA